MLLRYAILCYFVGETPYVNVASSFLLRSLPALLSFVDNVTAPHGRPNLRSRLHSCHAQEGGPRSPQKDMRGHWGGISIYITRVMRTIGMFFLRAITGYGMVRRRCGDEIGDELRI